MIGSIVSLVRRFQCVCIPWVEVCRNGCTQGSSSSFLSSHPGQLFFFSLKRKSCPGCSWLVCLALPFYLVAKLLRHAFFLAVNGWTPVKNFSSFVLSSQFLAVCVDTVIFFCSIFLFSLSLLSTYLHYLQSLNVALSPFTLPPLPSVLSYRPVRGARRKWQVVRTAMWRWYSPAQWQSLSHNPPLLSDLETMSL